MGELVRTWRARRPLDLRSTLAPLNRGRLDLTSRWIAGSLWKAGRNPGGPVSLRLSDAGGGRVVVRAWGPGARWALDHAPSLLAEDAEPDGLESRGGLPAELRRRLPGLRFPRTTAVAEAMLPLVVEQKVTTVEARRSWHRMVRAWGEPAPGPAGAQGLLLPPDPDRLSAEPYWRFHRFGLEQRRADAMRLVAAVSARLDECAALTGEIAAQRMEAVPGVGPWTSALTRQTALGDLDAVVTGDYNFPHLFSWTVLGERQGSDERMLEWLEPYRPWRGLAQRLIIATGRMPARRAPHAELRNFAGY